MGRRPHSSPPSSSRRKKSTAAAGRSQAVAEAGVRNVLGLSMVVPSCSMLAHVDMWQMRFALPALVASKAQSSDPVTVVHASVFLMYSTSSAEWMRWIHVLMYGLHHMHAFYGHCKPV